MADSFEARKFALGGTMLIRMILAGSLLIVSAIANGSDIIVAQTLSDEQVVTAFNSRVLKILKHVIYRGEMNHNNVPPTEDPYKFQENMRQTFSILYPNGNWERTALLVEKLKFDFLFDRSCRDSEGVERDAVSFENNSVICISVRRISKKLVLGNELVPLVALVGHELVRILGGRDELALTFQKLILHNLNPHVEKYFKDQLRSLRHYRFQSLSGYVSEFEREAIVLNRFENGCATLEEGVRVASDIAPVSNFDLDLGAELLSPKHKAMIRSVWWSMAFLQGYCMTNEDHRKDYERMFGFKKKSTIDQVLRSLGTPSGLARNYHFLTYIGDRDFTVYFPSLKDKETAKLQIEVIGERIKAVNTFLYREFAGLAPRFYFD
jgi:hypothetical protein